MTETGVSVIKAVLFGGPDFEASLRTHKLANRTHKDSEPKADIVMACKI